MRREVPVQQTLTVAVCLALVGCGGKLLERTEDGLVIFEGSKHAGGGKAQIKFDTTGLDAVQIVGDSVDLLKQVHMREVAAPTGAVVLDATVDAKSEFASTNAVFLGDSATFNWPILDRDGALEQGKFEFTFGVVNEDLKYKGGDLDVSVFGKFDDDLSNGVLRVNIAMVDDLATVDSIVSAVGQAVTVWRDLMRPYGLELDVYYYDVAGLAGLSPPGLGSQEAFRTIDALTPARGVNLVVAREVVGFANVFGISGDIPGPLAVTGRSAVLVSTDMAMGGDGQFNAAEITLFGETMAHEVGHYLGLFHPVETTYDRWDALEDTPKCADESECVVQMRSNLMFPFPVCGPVSCERQDVVTAEQARQLHRYVGVE